MLQDNWLIFLIMGIVLAHLLGGFVWVLVKMNKKPSTNNVKSSEGKTEKRLNKFN